ncbi:MAG: hypothetical protein FWF10_00975 [Clostridiales bacterium]|nr:hypothetical protein [Clostridiales bacterium]
MIKLALIIFFVVIGFALLIELAVWICQAIGMQAIAKRRGVKGHAAVWDIVFGVGQAYVAGAIADDYSRRVEGKETARRKLLLGLGIPIIILTLAISVLGFGMVVNSVDIVHEEACICDIDDDWHIDICDDMFLIDNGGQLSVHNSLGSMSLRSLPDVVANIVICSLVITLLTALLMPLVIVFTVFYYISLYKLYKSCDAKNAALYIVLSIFIPICVPIFLLMLRGKDDPSLAALTPDP